MNKARGRGLVVAGAAMAMAGIVAGVLLTDGGGHGSNAAAPAGGARAQNVDLGAGSVPIRPFAKPLTFKIHMWGGYIGGVCVTNAQSKACTGDLLVRQSYVLHATIAPDQQGQAPVTAANVQAFERDSLRIPPAPPAYPVTIPVSFDATSPADETHCIEVNGLYKGTTVKEIPDCAGY